MSLSHPLSYWTNGTTRHNFHFQKCLGAGCSQGGEQMSAMTSCSGRRCFAESMEGTGRTEIKATSPVNKAMVISLCQWQLRIAGSSRNAVFRVFYSGFPVVCFWH